MTGLMLIAALAAPPSLADYQSDIERCIGKVELTSRTEDAGPHAFAWFLKTPHKGADRVMVLKERKRGCDGVFTVGRANARVIAPFDPKTGAMKAFVVQNQPTAECKGDDEGGCERVLMLRDKGRRYLSVLPVGQCEYVMGLSALKVFADKPSILLECGFSGGGDMLGHTHRLYHVVNGQLTELLKAQTGYSVAAESAGGTPGCRIGPNGHLKVKRAGAAPMIETYVPDDKQIATHTWQGKTFTLTAKRPEPRDTVGQGPQRCGIKLDALR